MPKVRELTARFSFDVDKSGVREFNKTIGGMKRTLLGLVSVLGIGLGAKAFASFGLNLSAATFQARRFGAEIDKSGNFTGKLGRQVALLQKRFGVIKREDQFAAFKEFANLTEDFPAIQGKFFEFFKSAALISKSNLGNNFAETFTTMVNAVRNSNVSFLEELPGFTSQMQDSMEKIFGIFSGGFFLKSQQRPQIINQILAAMKLISPEMEKQAIASRKTLKGQNEEMTNEFIKTLTIFSTQVLKALSPAVKIITELFRLVRGGDGEFPVLKKLVDMLGLLPDSSMKGKKAVEEIKFILKSLGASMIAGILLGFAFGLPPIMGAAIGVAGGIGLLNLRRIHKNTKGGLMGGVNRNIKGFLKGTFLDPEPEVDEQGKPTGAKPNAFQRLLRGFGQTMINDARVRAGKKPLTEEQFNQRRRETRPGSVPRINQIFNFNITGESPELISQAIERMIKRTGFEFQQVEGVVG